MTEKKEETTPPLLYHLSNGHILINYDKIEERVYTPKEIVDIIVLAKGDPLPITDKFIESFGFKPDGKEHDEGFIAYRKMISEGLLILTWHTRKEKFTLYLDCLVMPPEKKQFFEDYSCTTQEQLHFLLTCGRIDCSK